MSFDDAIPSRPLWLITLADLSLLLVGFFVLLQASKPVEPRELADGIRAGFGIKDAMPVEIAAVSGFAPGSAELPDAGSALDWARGAARDPRTRVTVTGETDGTPQDVDAATGSAAILAADRARAVAALLVRSGAVAPDRIVIAIGTGRRRAVLTLGYAGGAK